MDDIASPATAASTGGRFFGFVIGGSLPAPMAVNMLAGVWDQNAGLEVSSPMASFMEELCRNWLVSMLGLGRDRVVRVAVDGQGRMLANLIPPITGPTIICNLIEGCCMWWW